MKIFSAITLILFSLGICHAQQDPLDKIAQQAVVIQQKSDSINLLKLELKGKFDTVVLFINQSKEFIENIKEVKSLKEQNEQLKRNIEKQNKEIENSQKELKKLERYKDEMNTHESQLKQKEDTITVLQQRILEMKKNLFDEKERAVLFAKEEKENGKNESLDKIINTYKNKIFDDLLLSSTKLSIERDIILIGSNPELKPLMDDLLKFFEAKAVIEIKYNPVKIAEAIEQLGTINQKSALVDKLIDLLKKYRGYNEGLKEKLGKIVELDHSFSVRGDREQEDQKYNMVLANISSYIFRFDFKMESYTYLSNIILDVLKRKQPNPDADISDLFKKL